MFKFHFSITSKGKIQKRIDKALECVAELYYMDGEHRKIYLIDQIVRSLHDCDSSKSNDLEYRRYIDRFDEWDKGTPP